LLLFPYFFAINICRLALLSAGIILCQNVKVAIKSFFILYTYQHFQRNLPICFLILLVAAKLSKIMEAYDVFVSVKPKPKQPSKVCFQRFFNVTCVCM